MRRERITLGSFVVANKAEIARAIKTATIGVSLIRN